MRLAPDKGDKEKAGEHPGTLRNAVYDPVAEFTARDVYTQEISFYLTSCIDLAAEAAIGPVNYKVLLDMALTCLKLALLRDAVPVVFTPAHS